MASYSATIVTVCMTFHCTVACCSNYRVFVLRKVFRSRLLLLPHVSLRDGLPEPRLSEAILIDSLSNNNVFVVVLFLQYSTAVIISTLVPSMCLARTDSSELYKGSWHAYLSRAVSRRIQESSSFQLPVSSHSSPASLSVTTIVLLSRHNRRFFH